MPEDLSKGLPSRSTFSRGDSVQGSKTVSTQILSPSERRRIIWSVALATLLFLAASVASKASQLNPETSSAWNEYIQAQTARVAETCHNRLFLWSDQSPDRIRRLREGEVVVAPMGENPKAVPHGMIHHWIGVVFLPGANLNDVLAVVRDYDKYQKFYAPNVVESRLLQRGSTEDAFSLRMLNKAVVTKFALDAEFQTSYTQLDENRWYSVGYSTRIREVEDYGQPNQYELPPDTGRGFIWRLYNIARFEQRDGGVYVELEAVALSREVPGALRWVINPVVRRASKGSMLVSLQKTQEAVLASNELVSRAATKDQTSQKKSTSTMSLSTDVDKGFASPKTFGPSRGTLNGDLSSGH